GFSSLRFDRVSASLERDLGPGFWEAWRRLGLTHVVVPRTLLPEQVESASWSIEGGTKVLQDDRWGFSAWRLPGRPWASFASGVVQAGGERDAYAAFVAQVASWAPGVVLEGPAPGGTAPGRVLSFERAGGRVRIDAEADGDALLVVNDAFWPGWEARIDGLAVPIQRADVLVRALPFPPGRHTVEMRYRPWEARLGLALSGIGLAALAALGVLGRGARHHPPSPANGATRAHTASG
ncbi:MAG TPA: YfhO family protein, partial [Anaeromyxobacteraceae bacterium]|nr:YfhO family protein [Anaeromyxobacteraceae bacterium]